jgi:hypothetical protein
MDSATVVEYSEQMIERKKGDQPMPAKMLTLVCETCGYEWLEAVEDGFEIESMSCGECMSKPIRTADTMYDAESTLDEAVLALMDKAKAVWAIMREHTKAEEFVCEDKDFSIILSSMRPWP